MVFLFINVHKQNDMTYPGGAFIMPDTDSPGDLPGKKFFKTLSHKLSYVNS